MFETSVVQIPSKSWRSTMVYWCLLLLSQPAVPFSDYSDYSNVSSYTVNVDRKLVGFCGVPRGYVGWCQENLIFSRPGVADPTLFVGFTGSSTWRIAPRSSAAIAMAETWWNHDPLLSNYSITSSIMSHSYWVLCKHSETMIPYFQYYVLFPHSDHVTHDITPKPHNPSQHQQWIEAMCFFTRVTCGTRMSKGHGCQKVQNVPQCGLHHCLIGLSTSFNFQLASSQGNLAAWSVEFDSGMSRRWQLFLTCRSRIPREESSSLAHAI